MKPVVLIRRPQDAVLVERTVLALLASEGVDVTVLTEPAEMSGLDLDEAELIIVAYTASTTEHDGWLQEVDAAADRSATLTVHAVAGMADLRHAADDLSHATDLMVDLGDWPGARRNIRSLLPLHKSWSTEPSPFWTIDDFRTGLQGVVDDWDHRSASRLVAVAVLNLHSGTAVADAGIEAAESTMGTLQNARYFDLERELGAAYATAGVVSPQLGRRLGQALIETGALNDADQTLQAVAGTVTADHPEWAEANGLLARSQKQRYFDALGAGQSPPSQYLDDAIDRYAAIYQQSNDHIWPGINAVSLKQRALRDEINVGATVPQPEAVADDILRTIDQRQQESELEPWDYATAAEAHLANNDPDAAIDWLDRYVSSANSFQLGSTLRQLSQVVEVDRFGPRGQRLIDSLEGALAARRGGASLIPLADTDQATTDVIPLLAHVTIDDWEPPDERIRVTARMGRVVSLSTDQVGLDALIRDLTVRSVERSRPHDTAECDTSIPFVGAAAVHHHPHLPEKGDRAIVALIDSGIDVLHQAFLGDDGSTRIARIWNQNDHSGTPPDGFDHGSEFTAADINRFITGTDAVPDAFHRSWRHGTHVASICAGRAVNGSGGEDGDGRFAGGMAPGAAIVVVIPNTEGPSVGYSKSHLEALKYIDQVAAELDMPVAVNVSLGQNVGAHDGKSPLEAAFNNFSSSGIRPGRVVVKSAGNERSKGGHATVPLGPHSVAILPWEATNDRGSPNNHDIIQIWCPYGNDYRFQLISPRGDKSKTVGPDRLNERAALASGNNYVLAFTECHDDNGLTCLTVEVGRGEADMIEPGRWSLRIESGDLPARGDIHAWIERDNARPISFADHVDAQMTLSIPGTAESVISVGAVSPTRPYMVAEFSSYGPTLGGNYDKPDLAAPGVEINAAAPGTGTGTRTESGTSMAAPHVTGAIALALSAAAKKNEELAANKIATVLRASTQNHDGVWRPDQGYGVLDVEAFLTKLKLI